jgi:NTE family protein
VRETASQDTIIIQINPIERKGIPHAASDILNRLNEVAFIAVLLKELRIDRVASGVADPGHEDGEKWSKMRVHYVPNEILTEFNASSKLIAEWDFFCLLRDEGRRSAQAFLEDHAKDLGRRSGLDLDILLEGV